MSIKSRLVKFLSKFNLIITLPPEGDEMEEFSFFEDVKKPILLKEDCFFYVYGPDGVYELPLKKGNKVTVSNIRLNQSYFSAPLYECEPKEKYDN